MLSFMSVFMIDMVDEIQDFVLMVSKNKAISNYNLLCLVAEFHSRLMFIVRIESNFFLFFY